MKLVDDLWNIGFWSEDCLGTVVETLHSEVIEMTSDAGAETPNLELVASSGSGV